jgi:hypothetical protein
LLQGSPQLGSKEAGEGLDVDEEGVAGAEPGLPLSGEAAARDEIMDVGMIM